MAKVVYSKSGKRAHFNGVRYTRDERNGYYYNSTRREYLHRAIREYHHGPIPEGYHVHHKDGSKGNNDVENLAILPASKHATFHGIQNSMDEKWLKRARKNMVENVIPKAVVWHRSMEGRKWHRKHYKRNAHRLHEEVTKACEHCGEGYKTTKNGRNRFCSNRCKSAWRRAAGLDDETRECTFCGKNFVVNKYSKTRYCSKTCSNRAQPRLPQLRESQSG